MCLKIFVWKRTKCTQKSIEWLKKNCSLCPDSTSVQREQTLSIACKHKRIEKQRNCRHDLKSSEKIQRKSQDSPAAACWPASSNSEAGAGGTSTATDCLWCKGVRATWRQHVQLTQRVIKALYRNTEHGLTIAWNCTYLLFMHYYWFNSVGSRCWQNTTFKK